MISATDNIRLRDLAAVRGSGQAPSGSSFAAAIQSAGARLPATDMDEIFQRAAERYQIPVNLLKAVAKAESGFNPSAVSAAGAQGVMQLMPATAAGLGVLNPLDPEQNIMGGAHYLSGMLQRYDGDVTLALAAYNAGSGNVQKYGGIPPFPETQNYIKKVMGYMGQDLNVPTVSGFSAGTTDFSGLTGASFGLSGLAALSGALLNMAQGEDMTPEAYQELVLRWKSELDMHAFAQLVGGFGETEDDSIF
ncbi:MAG: lytic transglycosylase protein [Firmicutes bacterium]|nr:lytic transglycosylase protein [Bacillota bacterium]